LQRGLISPGDYNKFALNPIKRGNDLAQQNYQSVVNQPKYKDIANVPPLDLTINERGMKKYSFAGDDSDEEVFDSVRKGVMSRETAELALQRQYELEGRGDAGSALAARGKRLPAGGGGNSTFNPLYFGEGLDPILPPPAQNYADLEEGLPADRGNTATGRERQVVNTISRLLGEVEALDDAGEPFRAANVALEIENYLQDVNAVIGQRGGELSERSKEFDRAVESARKKYEKAKRSRSFGKALKVIGTVGTAGMTDVSRTTPILGDLQKKAEAGSSSYVQGTRGGYVLAG
jgi:hypothetical protein